MGTLVAHETIYMRQPGLLIMMPEIQSKSREMMAPNVSLRVEEELDVELEESLQRGKSVQ